MGSLFNPYPSDISGMSLFGDGSDGDLVLNGTLNLVRDMFYNNLTLTIRGKIYTNNFRLFVRNTLINYGDIGFFGSPGSNGTALLGGIGGAATAAGTLLANESGANGGNPGFAGSNSFDTNPGLGGKGGNGGLGAGGVGGNSGNCIAPTSSISLPKNFLSATCFCSINQLGFSALYSATSGGGGGGATASGGGGGGGAAGAIVVICARAIFNYNRIFSIGGYGGNADFLAADAVGGGGGGGGGIISLFYNYIIPGTIDVSGGIYGLGYVGGANGTAGLPGSIFLLSNLGY